MAIWARARVWERVHLGLGSVAVLFWGGPDRQRRRFERRLLARYPALRELPPAELAEMARRVTAGVRPAHVVILSLAAGVAAAYLTTPILIALHALGVRVPMGVKVVLVNLDAWGAWWLVRRMLIDRQLTGAVSRAYPKLFCPCGYCLLGLPPSTLHCPECGVTETG